MKVLFRFSILSLLLISCSSGQYDYPYQDPRLPVSRRVEDLMSRMSVKEKVDQLRSDFRGMGPSPDYTAGNARGAGGGSPTEFAAAVNKDTEQSIKANRWGIPALQHTESLHGVVAGNFFTSFPQSIAIAATFDTLLCGEVSSAITEELRSVGIRQSLSPVVNISRDPRWGRNEETYGEDPFLASRMGVAYVKAMETGGVISTPKHFADNYGDGGRDSYASNTSWRVLRETYLEPFRACVQEGHSRSIMAAYNSVDGIPCSMNSRLLNDILREEWGFDGFVVSDYNSVYGVSSAHNMAEDAGAAQAMCCRAGLDVELHLGYGRLYEQYESGAVSEKDIDRAVERVLRCKFELGLFEKPYADTSAADSVVNCKEHVDLALTAARKSVTLLKNAGDVLPLDEDKTATIAVFGPGVNQIALGGYSRQSNPEDESPLQALERMMAGKVKIIFPSEDKIAGGIADADVILFFALINESEGGDRSHLELPSTASGVAASSENAAIVDGKISGSIAGNQEQIIIDLAESGKPVVVILQNGGAIDVRRWIDSADAVVELWYAGEKGAQALVETLFGYNNPGGRLPFTWMRHAGQIPLYYNFKPSGRGYAYNDDDGKPLFPFGYGLSYTTFEYGDFEVPAEMKPDDDSLKVKVTVKNTGKLRGDEVVQIYVRDNQASVVRPFKELKAFRRVTLEPGECRTVSLSIPRSSFALWDKNMNFTVESGKHTLYLAKNAAETICEKTVEIL